MLEKVKTPRYCSQSILIAAKTIPVFVAPIKRSYVMRPSKLRKLNALKTEHPNVNLIFNTIVNMDISRYYAYIFNENGTFDNQEGQMKTSVSIILWTH